MSRGYWDTSRARQLWGWQFGFYVCRGITRGRWVFTLYFGPWIFNFERR